MKSSFVKTAVLVLSLSIATFSVVAQTGNPPYKTGAGLMVDVGEGITLVGPHVKHFFAPNHAGEAAVLFGSSTTGIQLMYQYNQGIGDVQGLQWYLGLGGIVFFEKNVDKPTFGLAPAAGLDYKVNKVPLNIFFDWRPKFLFWEGDSDFLAARFAFGLRFTF